MRSFLAVVIVILCGRMALAQPGDKTLAYYLTNSTLVVAGRIETEPFGTVYRAEWPGFSFTFRVSDVIKGHASMSNTVDVKLLQHGYPYSPLLRTNTQCILFLRQAQGVETWHGFDPWFSIQPHNPALIRALKRLAGTSLRKAKNLAPLKRPESKQIKGDPPMLNEIPRVPEITPLFSDETK